MSLGERCDEIIEMIDEVLKEAQPPRARDGRPSERREPSLPRTAA